MSNVVKDIAAGLCRCLTVIDGTWAIVVVQSAEAEDGSRLLFDEVSRPLKSEFTKRGVSLNDVIPVTEHPEGFFLRNAIDNIAVGLMEPKFARVHFFCALEALRTSMVPAGKRSEQWHMLRTEFGITQAQIEGTLVDQALRHGDYANATPMSGAEMEKALSFVGEIICKYVIWFKRTKFSPGDAA